MNELQIFTNEEFGTVRMIEVNGEPWFVGKDISDILGYAEVANMRKLLEHDEYMEINPQKPEFKGFVQNGSIFRMLLINESGLYQAIFNSTLEKAKRFRHWVTSEVLPSIRKNGGYIANQEQLTPEQIVANALVVAQKIIESKDKQIETMKPKAEYFDALVERNLLTNFRDTAKELGISQKTFINFLIKKNYIYRDSKGKIKPYSDKNNGLFELKEFSSQHSEHVGLQTMITPKGRETFRLLLIKKGVIL